MMSITNPSQNK